MNELDESCFFLTDFVMVFTSDTGY